MSNIIIPRDVKPSEENKLIEHIATELGFIQHVLDQKELDLLAPGGSGRWQWEYYQRRNLECKGWYICNKPRQAGISTVFAIKAFVRAMLTKRNYIAVFVSYKREEAINKVQYVKQFLSAMPPSLRKKIIRDPNQLIEWENSNKTRVKILSHSQKEVRGLPIDGLYLDEIAFYNIAEEIYNSALPALGQTHGTVDIASTPFGKGGLFYEIVTDRIKYPNFFRDPIMWWHCTRYLKNPTPQGFIEAMQSSPNMTVEERVARFGNKFLNDMFHNSSDLETFQQEFEGFFVDEQAAFFPKDLLFSVLYKDVSSLDDYDPVKGDFIDLVSKKSLSAEDALAEKDMPIVERYKNGSAGKYINFRKYDSIQALRDAVKRGEVTANFVGGIDFGLTRHATDLTYLEEVTFPNGKTLQIERYHTTIREPDFDTQNNLLAAEIDPMLEIGLRRVIFDATGVGAPTGQFLEKRYPNIVIPVQFGGGIAAGAMGKKEEMVVNCKNRMTSGMIALHFDRETIEQFYSINRVISDTKTVKYKADDKKKNHSDRAFSIIYASWAGTRFNSDGTYKFAFNDASERIEAQGPIIISNGHLIDTERLPSSNVFFDEGLGKFEVDSFSSLSDPGGFINIFD